MFLQVLPSMNTDNLSFAKYRAFYIRKHMYFFNFDCHLVLFQDVNFTLIVVVNQSWKTTVIFFGNIT